MPKLRVEMKNASSLLLPHAVESRDLHIEWAPETIASLVSASSYGCACWPSGPVHHLCQPTSFMSASLTLATSDMFELSMNALFDPTRTTLLKALANEKRFESPPLDVHAFG